MVAQFLRLKLRLLANTFGRNSGQRSGAVLGLVCGLGLVCLAAIGFDSLRIVDAETARDAIVLGGSALLVGFVLISLVFGADDALDPRMFAPMGIPANRLARGLLAAAFVGVPAILLAIVAALAIFAWTRDVWSFVLAMPCAVIAVGTAVLCSRIASSAAAYFFSNRRSRDILDVVGIIVFFSLAPLTAIFVNVHWNAHEPTALVAWAGVMSWTPMGAVWSAPGDAAVGDGTAAAAKLLIALAFAAALLIAWRRLVARMLVVPRQELAAKAHRSLGWFSVFPGTPVGVIAARSVTYWTRDPRYFVSLIMIPIVPIIVLLPLSLVNIPIAELAALPVPVMCVFLGWMIHNDVAFDGTAVWLHVASGVSGRADRFGRMVPVLILGIPLVVIGSVISTAVSGAFEALPGIIGVSLSILLCGVGVSAFASARFPYPAVKPGDSPFQQPQSAGGTAPAVQSLTFFASIVLSMPALVSAVLGFLGDPMWFWAALGLGCAGGAAVFVTGFTLGSLAFDHRGPEMLEFADHY